MTSTVRIIPVGIDNTKKHVVLKASRNNCADKNVKIFKWSLYSTSGLEYALVHFMKREF